MLHFSTISALSQASGFPPPQHPQISLIKGLTTCPLGGQEFTTDCYLIAYKKMKAGVMLYGRTAYDHHNGCLFFVKPRQVMQFKNLELEEDSFIICMHEDFLSGHALYNEISRYQYFDYEVNEALHLSSNDEQIILDLYQKIETEYNANQDEYSKGIMLTHIDSVLKYSMRYYRRQFLNRTAASGKMVSKFNEILASYYQDSLDERDGLPSVSGIAEQLHLSPRYLSDLLKGETGKSAIELIHLSLVCEAKNRLRRNEKNISEIAFQLGFDNLSYFSKLFKREAGVSPTQFRKQLLN